jgi:large subunit ribosomal protein L23
MRSVYDVILKPIISERSMDMAQEKKYTFKVAVDAKKPEIASAVEQLFGVKVTGVNTANFDGKLKRQRYQLGRTPAYKKAVVSIDTEGADVTYLGKGGKSTKAGKKYKTSIEEFGFGQ